MLKIIFYFVWFANILLVVTKKKSKIITFFSFFLSFVLFAGNTSNPDYIVYQWAYNRHNIQGFEPGFRFLVSVSQSLSLNYQEMLMVVQVISLILIWICIRNVTSNVNAFWAIYFFAQQFIDIIQWRNYVASVFLLCAITLLYRNRKLYSLIFAIIASSFHITFSVFVAFILFSILKKHSTKTKIPPIIIVSVIVVVYTVGYVVNLVSNGSMSLAWLIQTLDMGNRYQAYNGNTQFGSVVPFIVYLFDTYVILWISRNNIQLDKKLTTILTSLNLFVGFFTPLLIIDIDFYRFFRDINILNFVFIAYALSMNQTINKMYVKQITMLFLMGGLWKIMTLFQGAIIFSSIYTNNLWLN